MTSSQDRAGGRGSSWRKLEAPLVLLRSSGRKKPSKSLYYATERPTCKNRRETACIKIREFSYLRSKKPGDERHADKTPLSGTIHEAHLQFFNNTTFATAYPANRRRSINRTRPAYKNQFNQVLFWPDNNFRRSAFFFELDGIGKNSIPLRGLPSKSRVALR